MTFKVKDGISIAGSTFVDSSRNVTANTLTSGIATGTAPLTITSTTLVSNLNADLHDGMHAVSTNTATSIVARDASGNFSAGTITAALSGNASTATALSTARNISLSTGVTGTATLFNGSADITIPVTSVAASYLSGTIPSTVLGNSTHYIGTTAITLNRASASQSLTGISIDGNAGTVTNGVYTTGTYSDPTWLTISKSKVGLSNVENTALSTWAGSTNITTIGAATATSLTVTGDLTVNGTTTTINSTTISVDDKNIELGSVATPTNTTADGGGITLKGTTDKTFNWVNATSAWTSSEHIATAAGKTVIFNGGTSGNITVTPTAIAGTTTLTLPATTGTLVTTGDTSTVTNTMLAGSIANAKLLNSSVTIGTTAIALGASSTTLAGLTSVTSTSFVGALTGNASTATTLATSRTLTIGNTGKSFNGSADVSWTAVEIGAYPIIGTVAADFNTAGQGIYRINTGYTNGPVGVDYGTLLSFDNASDTGFQLASDYTSNNFYWRSGNPSLYGGTGTFGAWRKLWHDGNTVAIANGGTGQTTANAAFNALVPSQTGNSGKYLTTDGTNTSWATNPLGTVTSVGLSLPSIFTVSGSPVTSSGTLTATLASQTTNYVLAAPNGVDGVPTFRALVAADIPSTKFALTLGTGLTGTSFNGSAAVTAAVSYGTAAGTACQGNDSRLSDARQASNTATQLLSLGVGIAASATTGEIRATNNITAYYSDRRLKENITVIENAVEKVMAISGVTYNSNDVAAEYGYTDKKRQVGVIAQEIAEVLPEVVVPAPFDIAQDENGNEFSKSGENYKTVQYEKLVPLLIEAIKEQQIQIDALRKELQNLK